MTLRESIKRVGGLQLESAGRVRLPYVRYPMISAHTDPVKQQVAAHWNRRAAHFDEDFGHSIRTPAERAAWERVLDLILPAAGALDALDIGCGTGFLSLELASRGHRVTGVDFAPSMIAQARKKAAERPAAIRYEEDVAAPGRDGRVDPGAAAGRAAHRRRQPG